MILCSPSNPTGSVYTKEELAGLSAVLAKHPQVIVIADEIYEHINYIGAHQSIAQFPEMKERTVIVNGVSKAYAMTGWRIGFIAGPEWIVKACNKLQGQYTSGPCSVSQKAAEVAYTGTQEPVKEMQKAFQRRRDLIVKLAKEVPGFEVNVPQGAFYLFPKCDAFFGKSNGERKIADSDDLAMYLLEEAHVACVGGARDLGRAISVKLAAEGAKVCLNYFDNEADAQETLALIKNVGGEAIAVQGDMTKAAAVKNLFAECNKAFGDKVDVLVNVVGGIVGRKKITEQDEDWYDFLMDVNMRSVFLCTREVVPMMPEGGSIVNFSSLAARDGGGNGASMYATAKGAVMTFTRSMAKELGPQGIRCNAICPGTIATSFHDRFNTPENRERMKGSYALRREGTAE